MRSADPAPPRASSLAAGRAAGRPSLRPLTALRFLAALAVFGTHAAGSLRPGLTDAGLTGWLLGLAQEGRAGVTFFFLLSGFILTYNYAGRLSGARDSVLRFYVARVGRIVPVHLLTLALAAIPFLVLQDRYSGTELAVSAVAVPLLLQAWVPDNEVITAFNGPSWSLSVEMFFYLLFPALLVPVLRLRGPGIRALVGVGILAWLVLLGAGLASEPQPEGAWLFFISPPTLLVEFLVGMLAGAAYLRLDEAGRLRRPGTALEVTAVLALVAATCAYTAIPASLRGGAWYLPFMLVVIWVFATGRGALARLLGRGTLVYLGEISFSFYMVHFVALMWIVDLPQHAAGRFSLGVVALLLLVSFVVTVLVSAGIFARFETPARAFVRRLGDRAFGFGVAATPAVDR